jgi:hypothetical protein
MRRRAYQALALLPALIVAVVVAGCGSGGTKVGQGFEAPKTGAGTRQASAFDPRDQPIGCLAAKGVQGVKDERYRDRIDVMPATTGAYVVFAPTFSEAQGQALNDTPDAAGAEVIGPALFTVGDLPDDVAKKIEDCLDARGIRY